MHVVYDPRHVLHDPATEVQYGVPMPMYEVPARVESIRAALLADEEFSFTGPTGHGVEPVTAVHHGTAGRSSGQPSRPRSQARALRPSFGMKYPPSCSTSVGRPRPATCQPTSW